MKSFIINYLFTFIYKNVSNYGVDKLYVQTLLDGTHSLSMVSNTQNSPQPDTSCSRIETVILDGNGHIVSIKEKISMKKNLGADVSKYEGREKKLLNFPEPENAVTSVLVGNVDLILSSMSNRLQAVTLNNFQPVRK